MNPTGTLGPAAAPSARPAHAGTPDPLEQDSSPGVPPVPDSLGATGLTAPQVRDLILKVLYQQGDRQGVEIADFVALPYQVLDDVLMEAQQRHFVEVLGTHGHGRSGYTYSLTEEGRQRARAALEASRYVGPAPVTLECFEQWVRRQSVRHTRISRDVLTGAFDDLVLTDGVLGALGPALNSGTSIFLYGAPGNGKTAIAERLGGLVSAEVYVPNAVLVGGDVMVLYDPVYHRPAEDAHVAGSADLLLKTTPGHDRRFHKVRRPTVTVGGELTMEQLDLQYDPFSKVYQAPFQLKATGGVLIVDDFGRQRMRPAELLNRWIVPLEKSFDNLSLHSGIKFPVPFDCILIFATNLNPKDLVDEAFLRRIQFKVEVRSPNRAAFEEILRINCRDEGVEYDPAACDLLFDEYYAHGLSPRGCHPRDLLHQVRSLAEFEGVPTALEPGLLRRAAHSYFLVVEEEYQVGVPSISGH
jgi:predicted ATPase with chaperone activity